MMIMNEIDERLEKFQMLNLAALPCNAILAHYDIRLVGAMNRVAIQFIYLLILEGGRGEEE